MQLTDGQLDDFRNAVPNSFSCAAGPDFPAGNERMVLLAHAVHKAQTNDLSVPDNNIAADQVAISIGNVFLCQNVSAKGKGQRLLVGFEQLDLIGSMKDRNALAAAGISWFYEDRLRSKSVYDAICLAGFAGTLLTFMQRFIPFHPASQIRVLRHRNLVL